LAHFTKESFIKIGRKINAPSTLFSLKKKENTLFGTLWPLCFFCGFLIEKKSLI
jgi:hypothetical protein